MSTTDSVLVFTTNKAFVSHTPLQNFNAAKKTQCISLDTKILMHEMLTMIKKKQCQKKICLHSTKL